MTPEAFALLNELIEGQKRKLFASARRIVPHVTPDDLLQPNDFPELEFHPHFRYEEGILDGLQVARSALAALKAESEKNH